MSEPKPLPSIGDDCGHPQIKRVGHGPGERCGMCGLPVRARDGRVMVEADLGLAGWRPPQPEPQAAPVPAEVLERALRYARDFVACWGDTQPDPWPATHTLMLQQNRALLTLDAARVAADQAYDVLLADVARINDQEVVARKRAEAAEATVARLTAPDEATLDRAASGGAPDGSTWPQAGAPSTRPRATTGARSPGRCSPPSPPSRRRCPMDADLPTLLRTLRSSRGLTLRDVERITEGRISNPYLCQLERGQIKRPSAHALLQLAAAYAVDVADLIQAAEVPDGR